MRNVSRFAVGLVVVLGMASGVMGQAQNFTGHYINGVEGIKGSSLPPSGLYLKNYVAFYTANQLNGPNGDSLPVDFDVSVFAVVPRLIWISDIEVLGGTFGADALIPLVYTDLKVGAAGVNDDAFAIGDLYIEPAVVAWHGARWDAAVGLSAYLPTADASDADDPANPGKDFWTFMPTLAGTWYADAEKTLSISILGRYEVHGEHDATDITPGDDFHFEWGLGKTLNKVWDVGLAGYCHWQVTKDDGVGSSSDKDQVFAVGPEVSVFCQKQMAFVSLRHETEFDAEDRSEGSITVLTVTKIL